MQTTLFTDRPQLGIDNQHVWVVKTLYGFQKTKEVKNNPSNDLHQHSPRSVRLCAFFTHSHTQGMIQKLHSFQFLGHWVSNDLFGGTVRQFDFYHEDGTVDDMVFHVHVLISLVYCVILCGGDGTLISGEIIDLSRGDLIKDVRDEMSKQNCFFRGVIGTKVIGLTGRGCYESLFLSSTNRLTSDQEDFPTGGPSRVLETRPFGIRVSVNIGSIGQTELDSIGSASLICNARRA